MLNRINISKFTFVLLVLISMPFIVFAHGGVEKSSGNVTVFLSQSPSSPLVGEKVKMTFVFANKSNVLVRISNLEVEVNLIDTFFGDATKIRLFLQSIRSPMLTEQ